MPAAPLTLNSPAYASGSAVTGVIGTAADGTSVSVARTRYTGGAAATLVGPSTNPGTASCTSAGESLQGGALRPISLESNAACSTAAGFAYAEVGGTGENTTRDAGDPLHYRIVVSNRGNVTLDQVSVRDPAPGSGDFTTTCGPTGPTGPGGSSGPGLPGTGSPIGQVALGLGASALVVGVALVAVSRRRSDG